LADLVEQAELKTGRRSEGIFFAASAFIRKVVGGVGLIVATMVLTFAGLKAGADPTQVPPDAVWRLGAFYVPTILSLWLAMLAVMGFYALSRDGHEENLRRLAERQAAAAE
ncbi:MAG: MFS transporter, partial [Alphaproteobacteria bacterium]|nr:MFS transporter [Alphaproteobacteria bacterium]